MAPCTRQSIVRRRKQGFKLDAIAREFCVSLPQVKCILKEAGIHPYGQATRKDKHEHKQRRRAIRELLDEGTPRKSLELAFGKDLVEEVASGIGH